MQSQRTTPVTEDDALNMETWSTLEQVIWAELGKVKEQSQEVPNRYKMCEQFHENQKSQERQLSGLRSFARRVEQFLTQLKTEAVAPSDSHGASTLRRGDIRVPLTYVPGASASSSAGSASIMQMPMPPTVPEPPIPTETSQVSKDDATATPRRDSPTRFSTGRSEVRSGAIRIDITDPQQWSSGDIAVIRNQEAQKVRDFGSLIFETPIQHDYEARS